MKNISGLILQTLKLNQASNLLLFLLIISVNFYYQNLTPEKEDLYNLLEGISAQINGLDAYEIKLTYGAKYDYPYTWKYLYYLGFKLKNLNLISIIITLIYSIFFFLLLSRIENPNYKFLAAILLLLSYYNIWIIQVCNNDLIIFSLFTASIFLLNKNQYFLSLTTICLSFIFKIFTLSSILIYLVHIFWEYKVKFKYFSIFICSLILLLIDYNNIIKALNNMPVFYETTFNILTYFKFLSNLKKSTLPYHDLIHTISIFCYIFFLLLILGLFYRAKVVNLNKLNYLFLFSSFSIVISSFIFKNSYDYRLIFLFPAIVGLINISGSIYRILIFLFLFSIGSNPSWSKNILVYGANLISGIYDLGEYQKWAAFNYIHSFLCYLLNELCLTAAFLILSIYMFKIVVAFFRDSKNQTHFFQKTGIQIPGFFH